MEHILIDCAAPGQEIIWSLAKELWEKKHSSWPGVSHGTIMGCCLVKYKNHDGRPNTGKNHLLQILISESAHLIWKIRCEQRMGRNDDPDKVHTKSEVHNRWLAVINRRLLMDCISTDKRKFGRKAINSKLVRQTWGGALMDERNMSDGWVKHAGVLVGIRPLRPPGQNR